MTTSRRSFLCTSALATTSLLGLAAARPGAEQQASGGAATPEGLRILLLGGTGFLGPHIVEAAIARGHTVTLFNRGVTNPHLFPQLEKLRGDRDPKKGEGLAALAGRTWDVVIDTSGYVPRHVAASAEALADAVRSYLFISTVSVYADFKSAGMDESSPVGTLDDETTEEVDGQTYGPLKALCEQAVQRAMGDHVCILRPGLIVGPRDGTDRFTYWPVRVRRGGEVLAPGEPNDPVQYIDVRDLASWTIRCVETSTTGTFNAVGPAEATTMAELLYGCKAVAGGDARFTWVPADFLNEHGVAPWSMMPVWVPPVGDYRGLTSMSNAKAFERGLHCRPLAETVRDTLDWFTNQPEERRVQLRAGLSHDREAQVLAAWHARP